MKQRRESKKQAVRDTVVAVSIQLAILLLWFHKASKKNKKGDSQIVDF